MSDADHVAHHIAQIAATADFYPGVVIIHHVPRRTVVYMSQMGLDLLDTTNEALEALGPAYASTYFNPVESDEYMKKVWSILDETDERSVRTLFQQVHTNEREGWSWYLTSMRLLLRDATGAPLLVLFLAAPMDPEHHFAAKVQRLIDENNFLRAHTAAYSCLTPREREVLQGVALGQSAAELAAALFISPQTVETHRRNLRHKLGATTAFELGQYARAFDLI